MTKTGLLVIGAGLPRTGTTSMKKALEELLDGPCYHMQTLVQEQSGDHKHWLKVLGDQSKGSVSDQDWIDFLSGRGFRAGVDFPISLFYKELMRIYPDAKVVLTVRDSPKAWYTSVLETVYQVGIMCKKFETRMVQKILGKYWTFQAVTRTGVQPFKSFKKGMHGAIENGLEDSSKYYEEWNEEVKKCVPKERLLIFNVKQGWKPLCDFLEIPVPKGDRPFPHVNETKDFQKMLGFLKYSGIALVYGVPAGLAVLSYCFGNSLASLLPF